MLYGEAAPYNTSERRYVDLIESDNVVYMELISRDLRIFVAVVSFESGFAKPHGSSTFSMKQVVEK